MTTAREILSHDFGAPAEELAATPAALARLANNPITATPSPLPTLSSEQLETFFNGSFEQGCREAMQLVGMRFHLASGALLMRNGQGMVACAAGGELRKVVASNAQRMNNRRCE